MDRQVEGGRLRDRQREAWEFAAWKNKILATNFDDNPQQITLGATAFADLTTALKARHIAVVRDFVVLANTFDASRWRRAVARAVEWVRGRDGLTVSPSTLSGYQDLKVNKVERVFGGEYGVILQQDRVWRMTFAGAPTVWQFDEVVPGIGVIAPGAAAQDGEVIYFLSTKGFFALERGTQATPIGIGRVDEFIRTDLDLATSTASVRWRTRTPSGSIGPIPAPTITAGDRTASSSTTAPRTAGRLIDQEVELLWAGGGTGISLDAAASIGDPLNIDDPDADVSFDDPRWVGGAPFIAAFDETYAAGSFSGSVRDAVLTTKEYAFGAERSRAVEWVPRAHPGWHVTAESARATRWPKT